MSLINLKPIKTLLFAGYIISSTSVFAVSNQEIMDSLIDIQNSLRWQEIEREMAEDWPKSPHPKYESKQTKLNDAYVLIHKDKENTSFFINKKLVQKLSNGNYFLITANEQNKTKNIAGRSWSISRMIVEINCQNETLMILNSQYFTKEGRLVHEQENNSPWHKISTNGISRKYFDYVCRK